MSSPKYKSTQPFAGCCDGELLRLEADEQAFLGHLGACSQCFVAQKELEQLKRLTARARTALALAQTAPTDAQWTQFKATLDSRLESPKRLWWLSPSWLSAVACVVAAVVVGWMINRSPPVGPLRSMKVASTLLYPHTPQQPPSLIHRQPVAPSVPERRVFALREVETQHLLEEGQRIETQEASKRFRVDERHTLTIAAHSLVDVASLAMTGVAFHVIQGSAEFEVARIPEEGIFKVSALDHTVEVLGTTFSVSVFEGKKAATISVSKGKVRVIDSSANAGKARVIETGESATIGTEPAPAAADKDLGVNASSRPSKKPSVSTSTQPVEDEALVLSEGFRLARSGKCIQSLSATARLMQSKQHRIAREALWLSAYCQRRLGNLEQSRLLFARYGNKGPLAIPLGDELPALP